MHKCTDLFASPSVYYGPRFVKPGYISTSSTLLFNPGITQMTWVIFLVDFWIHIYIYIYIYICIYIYIYLYVCVYIHTYVYEYIY